MRKILLYQDFTFSPSSKIVLLRIIFTRKQMITSFAKCLVKIKIYLKRIFSIVIKMVYCDLGKNCQMLFYVVIRYKSGHRHQEDIFSALF